MAFVYPNFDPVAVSIPLFGGKSLAIRWYGLMYLGGFFIAWLGMRQRAKLAWSRVKPQHVDDVIFYGALGGIAGGRIGYMLVYGLNELIANPLSLFAVWKGGMSIHGGLIGAIVTLYLYGRRVKLPFFVLADFAATWTPPGMMLGRIGNFINGELWGKPTSPDAPWAVIVNGEARHASQLYEAFLEGLVLFLVLWFYTRKPRPVMAASGIFLAGYGLARIAIEFVRVPDAQMGYLAFGWLTTGQVLSTPMVIAGVILIWLAYRRGSADTPDAAAAAAPKS